jgi:mannose-1-phosphate guanylyltransferase / phosphomannomutase
MASDSAFSHAIIIAGGLGSRAHAMTDDRIPKALLPVAGKPILFRQLAVLAREGVQRVTILAGHLGDQLTPALSAAGITVPKVDVLVERQPLGTAGCLATLKGAAGDSLIIYGDMLFDLDLSRLAAFQAAHAAMLTIVAHPNDHPETSDLLVERDGLVRRIIPAKAPRQADFRNLVPAGLYAATPAFFSQLQDGVKADMIHEVLPRLIARGKPIGVYNTPEYLRDVGTPKRHGMAEADIASGRVARQTLHHARPAFFFDVDGVLNEEPGGHGIQGEDQVLLLPGAAEALGLARRAGFLTVGVTNRPQLAKGMLDRDGLDRIFGRLETLLAREGAWLDRIYFCPHHPEKGHAGEVPELKITCRCRKPAPGLLEDAARDLNIDLSSSALIGDSMRDMGAARAAGVTGYGVRTGYGCGDSPPHSPDAADLPRMFDNVLEAVKYVAAGVAPESPS